MSGTVGERGEGRNATGARSGAHVLSLGAATAAAYLCRYVMRPRVRSYGDTSIYT